MGKQGSLDKKKQKNIEVLNALLTLGGKSDREIAKILGINNTTLSKRKRKLEEEGYIKEYTIIPDFHKIGLEYIVVSFVSCDGTITKTQIEEGKKVMWKYPEVLCVLQDEGMSGINWFIISAHRTYEEYLKMSKDLREAYAPLPHLKTTSLMFHTDESNFQKPFSFRTIKSILSKP